jgi:thymidylate kinase
MEPILTVTVKGIRGSGKTTALLMLKDALENPTDPVFRKVYCGLIIHNTETHAERLEVFIDRRMGSHKRKSCQVEP